MAENDHVVVEEELGSGGFGSTSKVRFEKATEAVMKVEERALMSLN